MSLDVKFIESGTITDLKKVEEVLAGSRLSLPYVNDLHGNFTQIDKISQLIKRLKENNLFKSFFSAGDNVCGGLFAYELEQSAEFLDLLTHTTIGNHELDYLCSVSLEEGSQLISKEVEDNGFNRKLKEAQQQAMANPHAYLAKALGLAACTTMCGNLEIEDQKLSPVSSDYINIDGQNILIIGVLNPSFKRLTDKFTVKNQKPEISVSELDPGILVKAEIDRQKSLSEDSFLTVVLSHCGLRFDTYQLAAPGVDIIIGGHSHFEAYQQVTHTDGSKTHIVQAGQNGEKIGIANFAVEDGKVQNFEHQLVDVDLTTGSIPTISTPRYRGDYIVTAQDNFSLRYKSSRATALMHLVADSILNASAEHPADIGLICNGEVRSGIQQGPLYQTDLLKIFPWRKEIAQLELSGKEISQMLQFFITDAAQDTPKLSCLVHCSGLNYEINSDSRLYNLRLVTVDGELEIDPERTYRLNCTDFFAMNMLPQAINKKDFRTFKDLTLHKVFIDALRKLEKEKNLYAFPQYLRIHPKAKVVFNAKGVVY